MDHKARCEYLARLEVPLVRTGEPRDTFETMSSSETYPDKRFKSLRGEHVRTDSDALLVAAAACGWDVRFNVTGSCVLYVPGTNTAWGDGLGDTPAESLSAALVAAVEDEA